MEKLAPCRQVNTGARPGNPPFGLQIKGPTVQECTVKRCRVFLSVLDPRAFETIT